MVIFGFQKTLGKEKKNTKEIGFLVFGFTIKDMKKKSNIIKIIKNLFIVKLFNHYIEKLNK